MRTLFVTCLGIVALATMRADTYSLQDFGINTNGSVSDPTLSVGPSSPYSLAGVKASGWDQATGLGTLTYTYDPGKAGTYFVNFFVDPQAGTPYFNEYGVVGGSAANGVSYQIDDALQGTIFGNFKANQFDNANDLPGRSDNYFNQCTYSSGGACNGDTAFGVGFKFTLTATQEVVFTLTGSSANPGGFYLEDVHPVDQANASEADYFLTASESIQSTIGPPPPPTPEPTSELLVGGGLLLIGLAWPKLRRSRVARSAGSSSFTRTSK